MKKALYLIAVLSLAFCCVTLAAPALAETTPKAAKTAYAKALKAQDVAKADYVAAKKAYKKAGKAFNKGSAGFFQWVAENKTGWKADDAREALEVLRKSEFRGYTEMGKADDATGLDNMKRAVDLLPVLAKKRAGDDNYPNLQPATVRSVYMATAQIHANASAETARHMMNDSGTGLGSGLECLAWGYSNPFNGWYDDEKESFDKVRAHVLKKYKADITTEKGLQVVEDLDSDTYQKEIESKGETGHYKTVCSHASVVNHYVSGKSSPDHITVEWADTVFFGLAKTGKYGCSCLRSALDRYPNGYTVSGYRNLFNRYYEMVSPAKEKKALTAADKTYTKAKRATKSKLATLKKAARPTLTVAKVKDKRVVAKWKKVAGASGYEVSVSTSKSKTKVVAELGSTAKQKVVKVKSAKKRQYVKVRAIVKVGGKTVYSAWSQTRASK